MSLSMRKKALLDCGCGCGGVCEFPCCENFNLEDATLVNEGFEQGSLGCEDIGAGCVGTLCDNGWRMSVSAVENPLWQELFAGEDICNVWYSDGTHEEGGLIGTFEFEVVVACIANGTQYKAFIRYVTVPSGTPNIPLDTWIETLAGWTCPDCSEPGAFPDGTKAYLWWEAFFDCTFCRFADYDYGPPEGCNPDTLYSVKYYFSGFGYCQ